VVGGAWGILDDGWEIPVFVKARDIPSSSLDTHRSPFATSRFPKPVRGSMAITQGRPANARSYKQSTMNHSP
jgi:hypothetical protein